MNRLLITLLLALASFATLAQSDAGNELRSLPWVAGPEAGKIGDQATIKLDDRLLFLGEEGTSKFLQMAGNPPRPNHYLIYPRDQNAQWWAVFHFSPSGYIKDDEKLDADALLKAMKEGDEEGNKERQRLGMPALYTDGWEVPPHYDSTTKRLEWGVRVRDADGHVTVNYSTRILGRDGSMAAILITDPGSLQRDRQSFNAALGGFDYNAGRRYAEYKEGDKVAAYGLGALVLGGAAAAAAKSGAGKAIFKGLWVAIVAGGAALVGIAKKLFAGRKTPGSTSQ